MQLTKVIQLPDTLSRTEKAEFLEDIIIYLHDQLEETESVPTQRAFSFIGTTGAIAAACSICGLGMVAPVIAIPGVVIIAACSIASGVTLAKDCIESPELIDLQKRLVHVLESKEIDQWVKLWEKAGTESFQRRLSYACKGSFTSKGAFRHNSGSNPFDVAVLFGGNKTVKPWEKVAAGKQESVPAVDIAPGQSAHTLLQPPVSPIDRKPVETTPSSAPSPSAEPTVMSDRTPTSNQQPITNNPQPTTDIDPTSEKAGLEILGALVSSRRSTLLIGDTGAGKSVTQAYILTILFELHPDAEAFVLAQKADSFCGLAEKGRVTLFDPTDPECALILIGNIWSIYDKRRRLPESERTALPPVRLILADWLSINQSLEELKNDEAVKASRYLSKLADIIYNGRELNVCLLVDLQSYNLAAVGLKADRNSRKNFNLIGLGNYSIDELGMVNESYGVLTNLIGDRYIVAEESERSTLNATFKQLQPISKENQRPIIFSSQSPARLALLPDLRRYKMSKVAAATTSQKVTTPSTEPEEEAIASSEPTTELKVSDSLKEPLKTLWLFAKKKNDWVTVRNIYDQKFKVLEGKKVEQIHQYLGLLADSGLGEIDEQGKAHSAVGFRAY